MPSILVDPAAFDPAAIPAETLALNKEIIARLEAEPTGLTIQEVRARRLQGLGAFPQPPKSLARNDHQHRWPDGQARPARHRAGKAARHFLSHPRRRLVDRRERPARSGARALRRQLRTCLRVGRIPARARASVPGRPRRLRGRGAVDHPRGDEAFRHDQACDRRGIRRRTSVGRHAVAPARQAQARRRSRPRS